MRRVIKVLLFLCIFMIAGKVNATAPSGEIIKVYNGNTIYTKTNNIYNVDKARISIDYQINNKSDDYCVVFYHEIGIDGNTSDNNVGDVVCNYNSEDTYSFDYQYTGDSFNNSYTNIIDVRLINKDDLVYITCDGTDPDCEEGYEDYIDYVPENIYIDTLTMSNSIVNSINAIDISNYKIYDTNNTEVTKSGNKYVLEVNENYVIKANITNYNPDFIYNYGVASINSGNYTDLVEDQIASYSNGVISFPFQATNLVVNGGSISLYNSINYEENNELAINKAEELEFNYKVAAEKVYWGIDDMKNLYEAYTDDYHGTATIEYIYFNNLLTSGESLAPANALDISFTHNGSVLMYTKGANNNKLYIEFSGVLSLNADSGYLFNGFSDVIQIEGLENLDTSSVTDMSAMFMGCEKLENIISYKGNQYSSSVIPFDTSSATTMASMFDGCKKLDSLDLSSWNTSNVTNMYSMFKNCESLTYLNIDNFNTSNVARTSSMFENVKSLQILDISSFDSSSFNTMENMFYGMNSIRTIYASKDFTPTGWGVNYFENDIHLVGGNGTTYYDAQPNYYIGYDRIDSLEHPGLFTYYYDVFGDSWWNYDAIDYKYILVGTGSFNANEITANHNVSVSYENDKLKFIYNNETINSYDVLKYSSKKYDLTKPTIDTGNDNLDLSKITVSSNITKNFSNGILELKYGNMVLESYEVYHNVRLNNYDITLYVNEEDRDNAHIVLLGDKMFNGDIASAVSSNTAAATAVVANSTSVDIQAVESGSTVVTITLENGRSAIVNVTVKNRIVNSLSAAVTEFTKNIHDPEFNLNVVVNGGADHPQVNYLNDNKNVVIVNDEGYVNLVGPGTAHIYVTCGGKDLTFTIIVYAPIESIVINGASVFEIGSTATIYVDFTPNNTSDSKSITWTSSDPTVASLGENCTSNNEICTLNILKDGTTTITATTVNNKTATYTVVVDSFKAPVFINTGGTISEETKIISRLAINIDVAGFISRVINSDSVKIYDSKNNLKTSGNLATGDRVNYLNAQKQEDYFDISIAGDVNGDAAITPLDYVSIKNHIMEKNIISSPPYALAADYNNDNQISPLDYVGIKNYIMKGEN